MTSKKELQRQVTRLRNDMFDVQESCSRMDQDYRAPGDPLSRSGLTLPVPDGVVPPRPSLEDLVREAFGWTEEPDSIREPVKVIGGCSLPGSPPTVRLVNVRREPLLQLRALLDGADMGPLA